MAGIGGSPGRCIPWRWCGCATTPVTRAYAARRRAQGKSPREIRRRVKRALARQLFKLLQRYASSDMAIVTVC